MKASARTRQFAAVAFAATAALTPATTPDATTLTVPPVAISEISGGWEASWAGAPGYTYFPRWSLDLAEWHRYEVLMHGTGTHFVQDFSNPNKIFIRVAITDAACVDPETADFDHDGLSNADELENDLDPLDADTDHDGVPDGADAQPLSPANGNPLLAVDSDQDGWSDLTELLCGTSPTLADSDGDGVNDALDAYPLDPTRSAPGAIPGNDTAAPAITLSHPANATLTSSN
jgi:hypothetical protein